MRVRLLHHDAKPQGCVLRLISSGRRQETFKLFLVRLLFICSRVERDRTSLRGVEFGKLRKCRLVHRSAISSTLPKKHISSMSGYTRLARAAPDELRGLDKELASLSSSLSLLVDELKDPSSTICSAGPDRVKMVNELKDHTQTTLDGLELFAKKHDIVKVSNQRSAFRKTWDRLRFVKDISTIDRLRSKLVYHYSVMQLLLTSAGNSSLQRMHDEQTEMSRTMNEIKSLVSRSRGISAISSTEEPGLAQCLFPLLLSKAQDPDPWLLTGLDSWIQVGRWWLMRAHHSLRHLSVSSRVLAQDYVDLIKASWILIDIVDVHPQRDFAHGSWQQLEIAELSSSVRLELERLRDLNVEYPTRSELLDTHFTIWTTTPSLVIRHQHTEAFRLSEGQLKADTNTNILFQCFGRVLSLDGKISYCLMAVIYDRKESNAALTCLVSLHYLAVVRTRC